MGKILPLATLLLATASATLFGNPNRPIILRSTPYFTDLTATSPEGIVRWEDNKNANGENKRDGIADKVSDWPISQIMPSDYTGKNILPAQQAAFDSISRGYLESEIKNFQTAYKNNPKLMQVFSPFGTEAHDGRAVLYTYIKDGTTVEYKLYEGANGTLSFELGTLSHKWGEVADKFLEIKDASKEETSSPNFYAMLKGLADNLTSTRDNGMAAGYATWQSLFADTSSPK